LERDFIQIIGDPGDFHDVLKARTPALSAREIEHFHAAAIGPNIEMISIKRQVQNGVESGQGENERSFFESLLNEAPGSLDYH
jgi:hypothetical protein